jgi:hypothetical protein
MIASSEPVVKQGLKMFRSRLINTSVGSILTAIASVLIANAVLADPPASSLPDGDQYVATLAQDVDNVASAHPVQTLLEAVAARSSR